MTAASYIKTLSALHPRPAFKRRALRLSATWRSILFFLMACNQCGNNNSARKKQFPPAWHSSFLRSFSDFSSFSSNACMAILFLNNIQKKLFAEAFKVLDFATPILGVQKPAKPRSSNCGLPRSCFGSPDLGTIVSRHDFSKGLFCCLFSNSSSTPPTRPFIVRHLSSRFCTPDTLAIPGLHTSKF